MKTFNNIFNFNGVGAEAGEVSALTGGKILCK